MINQLIFLFENKLSLRKKNDKLLLTLIKTLHEVRSEYLQNNNI